MPQVTTPIMTDATGRTIVSAILASAVIPAKITIEDDGNVSQELIANTAYYFTGDLTSLTITLGATSGAAHYRFSFVSGSTALTLTLPNTVTMPDNFAVEASKRYEIDILDDYGVVMSWTSS